MQQPLAITLLVVGLALIGVVLALGQHAVDQPRQLARSRRHRLEFVQAGAHPSEVRAQRRLAGAQGAAARGSAWAARLAKRLVLPLTTKPPVILVPGHNPMHRT